MARRSSNQDQSPRQVAQQVLSSGRGGRGRTGRAPAPKDESKHDKFIRIGTRRMENLLRDIRLLGNLAASNYEVYPEDVGKMHSAIEHELGMAFSRFDKARRDKRETFRFGDNGNEEKER